MTPERFKALFAEVLHEAERLAVVKGGEYAPGADRLANFKTNAEALGVPPEVVWAVFAGKHWDSIRTYVGDLAAGKDRKRSEPITGRLMDLIVYSILGIALLEDREGAEAPAKDTIPGITLPLRPFMPGDSVHLPGTNCCHGTVDKRGHQEDGRMKAEWLDHPGCVSYHWPSELKHGWKDQ